MKTAENTKRGRAAEIILARQAAQTHCLRGHEFTKENTYMKRGTQRICRQCQNATARAYRARKSLLPDAVVAETCVRLEPEVGLESEGASCVTHNDVWGHDVEGAS